MSVAARSIPRRRTATWVPPQGNYAFDLIVEVGLARFRQHRQNGEIQQEISSPLGAPLAFRPRSTNWPIPFWTAWPPRITRKLPELRKRLEEDGGYVLHVDGTCEPGTDTVFNAVAGNRGWTLAGAKMSGEDVQQIAALLRRCRESFGTPLAAMRDLSSQIETARKEALADVPDLICHYHFLENVGTKLCEKPHTKLTAGLRRLKIQSALRSLRKDLVRYSKQQAGLSARADRAVPPIAATAGEVGPASGAPDGDLPRVAVAGGFRGGPPRRVLPL